MKTQMKRVAVIGFACFVTACGGSSPTTPSMTTPSPTPTPTPTPSTWTLSGTVTSAAGGAINSATVVIADGPNAGKSATTDDSGHYTLASLTQAGFTVNFSAPNFVGISRPVTLTSNVTLNASLLPAQLWTHSGSGNSVFDMPTYISRIHIIGTYTDYTSNFIVRIGGRLVVNDLVGTGWASTVSEGTYLTTGGIVEITNSSGVSWSFTEVR